jgi:porphobilinogen deaminase
MDPLDVLVQDRISELRDDARRAAVARSSHRRRLALLLHRVADLLERRGGMVETGLVDRGVVGCGPATGTR